jgi:hypothetical protein
LAQELAEAGAHFRALPTAVRRQRVQSLPQPQRLLLQAIITKQRGDVQEDDLRRALVPAWRGVLMASIRSRRLLDKATWPGIRALIARAYEEEAWRPVDSAAGDLLVMKRGFGSIWFIDQGGVCVRDSTIGVEHISDLLDALDRLPAASKARGLVTTTADFAPGLRAHARVQPLLPARLALRNRHALLHWVKSTATTIEGKPDGQDV